MSDLFSPGRNVVYFRCNTKEWVDAAIVGPSARGGSYIKLKYTRDGREFEWVVTMGHMHGGGGGYVVGRRR